MAHSHFPALEALHERHEGLTEAVCRSYDEAARVCLAEHHTSPTDMTIESEAAPSFMFEWAPVTARERRAWANAIDAVEAGGYGMAIAAVEVTRG